jgi:hypothetical protein
VLFKIDNIYPELIDLYSARFILWGINCILFILILAFFLLTEKANRYSKILTPIIYTLAVAGFNYFLSIKGLLTSENYPIMFSGNLALDSHPPLRLVPLFLGSLIFGISNIGFRFSILILCFIVAGIIFNFLEKTYGKITSLLIIFCFLSLSPILHVLTLVEPSVYAAFSILITYVILFHSIIDFKKKLVITSVIVSVSILMRMSSILSVLTIVIFSIYEYKNNVKFDRKIILVLFALVIVSFLLATSRMPPSADTQNIIPNLIYAIYNNIPGVILVSIFGLVPIILSGAVFLIKDKKDFYVSLVYFSILCSAIILFYGPVRQDLWGITRYQTEYFLLLYVIGLLSLVKTCQYKLLFLRKEIPIMK